MKKTRDIIGLPIINIIDGIEVGRVKNIITNAAKGAIEYLLIDSEIQYLSAKIVPTVNILGIGEYAVTIDNEDVIRDLNEIPSAIELLQKDIQISGTKLLTKKGSLIGEVGDFYVDEDNGCNILGFEYMHNNKIKIIPRSSVISISKNFVVVTEEVKNTLVDKPEDLDTTYIPQSQINLYKDDIQSTKTSIEINTNETYETKVSYIGINEPDINEIKANYIEVDGPDINEIEENDIQLNGLDINEIKVSDIEIDELELNEIEESDIELNEIEESDIEINELGTNEFEESEIEINELELDGFELSEIEFDELEMDDIETNDREINELIAAEDSSLFEEDDSSYQEEQLESEFFMEDMSLDFSAAQRDEIDYDDFFDNKETMDLLKDFDDINLNEISFKDFEEDVDHEDNSDAQYLTEEVDEILEDEEEISEMSHFDSDELNITGVSSVQSSAANLFEQRQKEYLTGRRVTKTITTDSGKLIIDQGDTITDKIIEISKQHGKLIELIMNNEA